MIKPLILLFFFFTQQLGFAACVSTQWANLKEGPGLNFETKWVVPKNTPLKVIKIKADWVLIEEVDHVRSWVSAGKVTDSYFCGIVKREKTRLKDKLNNNKLAYYDQSFRIIKIKKKARDKIWALVKNQVGLKGWINKKALWVH